MNYTGKIIATVCAGMFLAISPGAGYCQEEVDASSLIMINGWVTEVDTFNSVISVKWQGSDYINYNNLTFKIPEGMKFWKNGEEIDIFDISIGDPVTIQYRLDKSGTPKVARIDVSQ